MGTILPKWKKQKSSKETLEAIETGIQSLIQNKNKSQQCERSLVGTLIMSFFLLYLLIILVGVVIWVWFNHLFTIELSVIFVLLICLIPIMVYGFRKLISTYFMHRKTQYDFALQMLRSDKKKVLDEVMEKEPYKIAKELLEKYEPSHSSLRPFNANKGQENSNVRQRNVQTPPTPVARAPSTPHPALRHRFQQPPLSTPQATPKPTSPPQSSKKQEVQSSVQQTTNFIPPGHCFGPSPGPPFPVPILPRERSNFDKVVEYILGDGPSNRYALICSNCQSHNGMALKEEFEYIGFRCAYCYHLNPARKTKPQPVSNPSTSVPSSENTSPIINNNNMTEKENKTSLEEKQEEEKTINNQENIITDEQ